MADEPTNILEDGDYEAAFNEAADNADSWQEPPADAGVAEDPVVETQPTEPEPIPEPEPKTSPEVEQIEQKLANMEKLLAEAAKRAESQAPAPAQATPEADADAAALKEVQDDWPTIHRAMEVRIKQLEAQLTQAIGGIEQRIKGEFAPMTKAVAETTQERFLSQIHTAHPDADTLLPEAEKWIATQPKFLQAAYNQVLDQGSAQDVVAFYDTFKTATGRNKPAEEPAPESTAREQRLRQMEGVRAERSSATGISDDDFEGAFERAARAH